MLVLCSIQFVDAVLPYEPVQYLSAHLHSPSASPLGDFLKEASAQDAASWMSVAKDNLKKLLADSETSVVLMKGEHILVQHRAKGVELNSSIETPPANVLSIVSIVLPILLEGFDDQVIKDPISKVLKENNPSSFVDILTKLSGSVDEANTLSKLTSNGLVSLRFLSKILGDNARDAWMDAYMALGVASAAPTDKKLMKLTFEDLKQISYSIAHDLVTLSKAKDSKKFPLDDDKYLFGWWFNCPKDSHSNCLIPSAPADTIFSLSPELRLYITPSLELTLIILGPGANSTSRDKSVESIADIIVEDTEIWNTFNPSAVAGSSKRDTMS